MKLNSTWVIRVNASRGIGFGHVVRCYALAEMLGDIGAEVWFATNYPEEVGKVVKGFNCGVVDLSPYSHFSRSELDFLLGFIGELQRPVVLVVDSYDVPSWYLKEVKETLPETLLVAVDDLADRVYPVDVLINGNVYAPRLDYSRQSAVGTRLLLGLEYLPLRREFHCCCRRVAAKRVKDILLVFGGSDVAGLTQRVLSVLLHHDFVGFELHVVLGPGFSGAVKSFEKCGNVHFYRNLTARQIKGLMQIVDIAVSSGGSTLYELLMCGVPVVAITVASNQLLLVGDLSRRGVVVDLDVNDTLFEEKLEAKVGLLVDNRDVRQGMMDMAHSLMRGSGRGLKKFLLGV